MRMRARSGLLASYALVVLVLVTLNFFLPRALPGRPIETLSDPRSQTYVGDATTRTALQRYYGLDRPLLEQYGRYMADLSAGDLGTSIRRHAPVARVLGERIGWTLLLVGTAVALGTALGMIAGVRSGWRRGRRSDRRLLALLLAFDNLPSYFLASAFAYVFAVRLGWFPLYGARTPFSESYAPARAIADVAHHLALPAAVLALQLVTFQYLVMRASMVGELGSDHLLLGRAKGMSEHVLKYRYAARNALLPAVTVATLHIPLALTAAIFVETVFAYPGIGRLLFESVGDRDYPLMQGCFLVLSLLVVSANLLADLLYRRLDPRTAA
ncbi:MAG: ABC transporter, permease protein 1 (cluster 5, nickel/peptides/opines) [uncultured Solirubrobacteraceae bacterium]|uniref:ABC transporter, permease protein 1 (Cluster 5, nickel/peptides/opines) n=1 Tax=uncultured Solirubrobacteraceae bacterium TaxID=1162706 RepID=A0A6J4RSB1_9ACTN|nr:MAG: ABC transporter, permease protein 1 (cluster 5, nickel/peptides/opines) [uncultured Solirubrobacteraceae bacterium]